MNDTAEWIIFFAILGTAIGYLIMKKRKGGGGCCGPKCECPSRQKTSDKTDTSNGSCCCSSTEDGK